MTAVGTQRRSVQDNLQPLSEVLRTYCDSIELRLILWH